MAHLTAVAAAVSTLLLDPLRRPLNVIGVWRAEGERCLSLLDETTRGVERQVRHSVVGVAEPRVQAPEGSCAFCVLEWLIA